MTDRIAFVLSTYPDEEQKRREDVIYRHARDGLELGVIRVEPRTYDGLSPDKLERLTPHFHNITIENVKSVNSAWAGVIIGLPEAPVTDIVLNNVAIQAQKGMAIAYATVTGSNVKVTAAEGQAITVAPTAKVTFK